MADATVPARLSTYVEPFITTHRYTASSQGAGRRILARFIALTGDPTLEELGSGHVEAWWATVSGLKPASRRTYHSAVKCFLGWLRDSGRLVCPDPIAGIARPKATRSAPRTFEGDEMNRLRAACTNTRDRAIVELAWGIGLRCMEIAALRIDDIEWVAGIIAVSGKGGHVDLLPLPVPTAAALEAYLAESPAPAGGTVVRSRHRLESDRPVTPHRVSVLVSNLAYRAGIKQEPYDGRGAHGLRRTCATELLDSGATIRQVQQILRHESLASTEKYLRRSTAEELRGVIGSRVAPVSEVVPLEPSIAPPAPMETPEAIDSLLMTREVAELLGCSRNTVQRYVDIGRLRAAYNGRGWANFFDRDDVEALKADQR